MADPVSTPTTEPIATSTAPDLAPAMERGPAPTVTRSDAPPANTEPKATAKADAAPVASGARPTVDGIINQLMDLPARDIDALIAAIDAQGGGDQTKQEYDTNDDDEVQFDQSSQSQPSGPVRYSQIEPGMQKAIAAVHNQMLEKAVSSVIDSDNDLSYNMKGASPNVRKSIETMLKKNMEELIDAQGDRFSYDWNTVAKQALDRAKPIITPFFERPTPKVGVGPNPGTGWDVANRPMAEPKRIPAYADEADWNEYIEQRLAYNQQQFSETQL